MSSRQEPLNPMITAAFWRHRTTSRQARLGRCCGSRSRRDRRHRSRTWWNTSCRLYPSNECHWDDRRQRPGQLRWLRPGRRDQAQDRVPNTFWPARHCCWRTRRRIRRWRSPKRLYRPRAWWLPRPSSWTATVRWHPIPVAGCGCGRLSLF